ncbi:MAG TPA: ABC transporter permease [Gemmataceae bacterium]|jgi:simple sugar transport system permease protein|nr:ABC transporter permease [Gemmataceae bacterium]
MKWREFAQTLTITILAIVVSLLLFSVFAPLYLLTLGKPPVGPVTLLSEIFVNGFGSVSQWQDTLSKAAPLILTALCTALPARIGLIVIGAEGALALGALAAAVTGVAMADASPFAAECGMAAAGMMVGGLLILSVGGLRYFRGVNETISSLLIAYIAIAVFNYMVEGPLRDPSALNKPSTYPISEDFMISSMFGYDIHWGLAFGVIFCFLSWILLYHTTFGFASSMVGGNVRAAQAAGLPVGRLFLITTFLAGAAAGLAGMVEVAANEGKANATLLAGYGFKGILVSFIARHNPLAIIPVAIMFGGLGAASGPIQRHIHLPESAVNVLTGILFIVILSMETLYGRFKVFQARELREVAA